MSVKGYDREIFVAASGAVRATVKEGYDDSRPSVKEYYRYVYYDRQNEVRLEFFALSADIEGKMTQEPLTVLTHEIPYMGRPYSVSMAVGDFDGDKHDNEAALMINTRNDIYIYVYRLTLSNGNLELKSLGDSKGIHAYSTDKWGAVIQSQPVSDMVAGDFDGDGIDEIALLYKIPRRAASLKHKKSWPEGPMIGDIHCKIHKWNPDKRAFDTAETSKSYTKEEFVEYKYPYARVSGVIGLRAAAADLNGDGRDEIVTLLLGYMHRKGWQPSVRPYQYRRDDFYAYPHLAVWKFDKGITPVHDDAHVKGGGKSGDYEYNYGTLYDLAQGDKNKRLLMDDPHLSYIRIWFDSVKTYENMNSGTHPDDIGSCMLCGNFQ